MSEIETRPASTRGRTSTRGGRGGFGRGGTRGSRKPINGTAAHEAQPEDPLEDEGELGDMKRKYTTQLPVLKDMFADWTDVDLLFALQECDGDLAGTVDRITQGNVSQFSEVKKNKDRARSKVKEDNSAATTEKSTATRGGRGRGGFEGARGRGGRATERGRGSVRGGRGGHATANGTSKDSEGPSVPTTESSAWSTGVEENAAIAAAAEPTPAAAVTEENEQASGPKIKSWASMFSQPPKPPVTTKPTSHAPPLAEPVEQLETATRSIPEATTPAAVLNEDTQPAILAAAIIADSNAAQEEEELLPPPAAPLTQENVEHLPDESHPPATHTAASTVDSNDPRNLTPLPGQQAPISRPLLGGFAASAQRAASGSLRSASFQRRVQEQQEAVVMPGHSAVDRATVQFGSMGLNGEPGLDVDEQREDPETRQAPQHSPPSQPKASLPPSSRQTVSIADAGISEAASTKQAPGLPPASQQNQPQIQESALTQGLPQEHSQHGYGQNQYSAYGQSAPHQEAQNAQQKPYDPFGTQSQHVQYDRFGHQNQAPQQASQQGHAGFGGLPTGQHDYSSYYGSEQQRYNQYYGSSNQYGTHDNRAQAPQQDTGLGQQRATSGYGSAPNDTSYGAQPQQQARYAEGANSGHNTPNPLMAQQQSNPNTQHSQSMHQQQSQAHQQQQQQQQQHGYPGSASGFPYGHPYFNSPYAQAYQNQFGFSGYGGGYPSKSGGGIYGAPQGYGMGSQTSYEQHSSSPANSNAFSQSQTNMRSGSGISSGLSGAGVDEYGRSTQASSQTSAFGGMNDPFARTPSGFGQGVYGGQTTAAGTEDSLKPFAESKAGSSPAMGQPGRPGSATNTTTAAQSSHTHPQPQQGGFGGYQGYPTQNSQYGGLGGLGGHQQGQTQQNQYAQYGSGAFSQYGSYNQRGGWGQSYGGH